MSDAAETAILAGGCFWGVQELLRHRDAVLSTRVGYTGGESDNPTDEDPGTGRRRSTPSHMERRSADAGVFGTTPGSR
jgi:peptide methionine sulfoxide reductase MsrA